MKKYLAITPIASGSSHAYGNSEVEAINNCIAELHKSWGSVVNFDGNQSSIVKTFLVPDNATGWVYDGFLYFELDGKYEECPTCAKNHTQYFR